MSVPIEVSCERSPECCAGSTPFYGQGQTFLNAETGFILDCPPGFSCDAGFFPTAIIVKKGETPFTPPTGQNPLRATCCTGEVLVRYLSDGFTQAQFAAAAQSLADELGEKLAFCKGQQYLQQHARRPVACTITTASPLPEGDIGVAYSETLEQSGATEPVTWSLLSGALPPGLSLSSAGVISGTPTGSAASYGFVVRLSNTAGTSCTKLFTLTINGCGEETDWCVSPGTCRVRVKDFNLLDWTFDWDGNLPTFGVPAPPFSPCGGFQDDTGFVGLNYSVSASQWQFSILCADFTTYLAIGPAGPSTTSPIGIYTKDAGSDPACGGPDSFEIEAYTP